MVASAEGHAEIVEALLAKGADPSILSSRNETAIKLAKLAGHKDVVDLLQLADRAAATATAAQTTSADADWQTRMGAAKVAQRQGKYVDAEAQLLAALKIAESFGEKDTRLGASLNRLAHLYYLQGKYTRAEPLYRRALTIAERTLGPDDPELASSLTNLAAVYDALGRHADAAPFHKRALTLRQKAGRTTQTGDDQSSAGQNSTPAAVRGSTAVASELTGAR